MQDTGDATDMMELYTDHSNTNKIIHEFTCAVYPGTGKCS